MTNKQMRLFALLGVAIALSVISYFFKSDTSVAQDTSEEIFMGFVAISPISILIGFIAFFSKKKELGLWLIFTPCIVVITMLWVSFGQ
jgi:hypothetical protein